jgi:hypothetical protein
MALLEGFAETPINTSQITADFDEIESPLDRHARE